MISVAINGLGRIGKSVLRIILKSQKIKIVAINEINKNIDNIAYILNYDTTYGNLDDKFRKVDEFTIANSTTQIKISTHDNICDFDFKLLGVDALIDASGSKKSFENAKFILSQKLTTAVFLTHPSKYADINLIFGVNEDKLDISRHKLISTSSCNATALAPILEILDKNWGIEVGEITTIHPFLNHQKVLDGGCIGNADREVVCNFEFGRSSSHNIIPAKTTTIEACEMANAKFNTEIFGANSFRVPTQTVGAINASIICKNKIKLDEAINVFCEVEENQKSKIIKNNFEPLVSSDFKGEEFSAILDHRFSDVKLQKLLKLVIWYDNEWGYASKVVSAVEYYFFKNQI